MGLATWTQQAASSGPAGILPIPPHVGHGTSGVDFDPGNRSCGGLTTPVPWQSGHNRFCSSGMRWSLPGPFRRTTHAGCSTVSRLLGGRSNRLVRHRPSILTRWAGWPP